MTRHRVGIWHDPAARYSERPPFHPPERYPELSPGSEIDPTNGAYASVRGLFRLMGYDAERFGSPEWNPLGWLVRPGDRVFLKPNMIAHKHRLRDEWDAVITNGSVIRAVADYIVLAMRGEGTLMIGDAPQTDSSWKGLVDRMGLEAIGAHYVSRGVAFELLDLRDEHHVDEDGIYVASQALPGDPRGGVAIDLARHSMFDGLDRKGRRYYGAYYDVAETNTHHRDGRHAYMISRSPLEADVFVNLPKLKTHKKCGFTVNLKSLVGINADKNWLPHYVFGAPENGGDQFDRMTLRTRLENAIVVPAKQLLMQESGPFHEFAKRTKKTGYAVFGDTEEVIRSGNWHGNDTVWRMSIDLNRILLYGNPDGTMREGGPAKQFFSVVDGIVAMEGNGPVAGDRREAGVLLTGTCPVAVDTVSACLMGFDPDRLPILREAWRPHRYPLCNGNVESTSPVSNVAAWERPLSAWRRADTLAFRPHFGWTEKIERA